MSRNRVRYERDETGACTVNAPAIHGCRTYGRTIEQARERVRQALSLFASDAERTLFS